MRSAKFPYRIMSSALAGVSGLLGLLLFASPASARVIQSFPEGQSSTSTVQPVPVASHIVVAGGMAGWQVALIAIGSALLAAVVAVIATRTRNAHRDVRLAA
jgi:hypothetical protein